MSKSSIEWTDYTWSPIRSRVKRDAAAIARFKGYTSLVQIATKMAGHVGPHCEHVSDGCENCYAGTNNQRCLPSNGTGLPFDRRARDLVDIFVDERILREPNHRKKPRRIFVENQSDLFGEWVTDQMIDRVVGVMAWCHRHTFQVLTKRAGRLREYSQRLMSLTRQQRGVRMARSAGFPVPDDTPGGMDWPLPNVQFGVSIENQPTADERIIELVHTPAAVRFVSYEPALEPVSFRWAKWAPFKSHPGVNNQYDGLRMLDWVIVGGESGPGARPFDVQWARDTVTQCKAAGVACFVKQLGAQAFCSKCRDADDLKRCSDCRSDKGFLSKTDRKGGNPDEWPADLRVREFPESPSRPEVRA